MNVVIDENSGFCFGVVNAISKAEKELDEKGYVISLGDIVHNKMEMQRLEKRGLTSISYDKLTEVRADNIFIRAHGEPPSTYKQIKELGCKVVDATCPVVARLQKQVILAYETMSKVGGQVVILGKRGHAEVIGLSGQIEDKCIIIESVEELNTLVDFSHPIYLLSQTTQPLSLFNQIKQIIESKSTKETKYIVQDTICRNVSNREPLLREFVTRFDLVLFVSGADSSNGKALYQVCLEENKNTKKIESEKDIDPNWLENINNVGICGATSTPRWLMERVANFIKIKN